ncbi:ANTAR domain-containing protein [Streptomyces sp. BV286]|uniref:ANTAR domain-containing protein n=2 Tax=unclassified Streptomyces TaxID=2593676 RepID=UPI0027E45544|nr:ANTAR domain-containing protein [Streptomyces sp. BV286]
MQHLSSHAMASTLPSAARVAYARGISGSIPVTVISPLAGDVPGDCGNAETEPRQVTGGQHEEAMVAVDATPGADGVQQEGVEEQVEELRDENAQLQEAVHSHAVVDQAIGVMIAVGQLTPFQGWEVLREVSQRTNIKLRNVAELVVEWPRTGELSAGIRAELEQQLDRARSSRPPE